MNKFEFAQKLNELVNSDKTLWLKYGDDMLVKLSKETYYEDFTNEYLYIMVGDVYERNDYFEDVFEDLGNYQLKKIINYNARKDIWELCNE